MNRGPKAESAIAFPKLIPELTSVDVKVLPK